jgi:hypothetical protein
MSGLKIWVAAVLVALALPQAARAAEDTIANGDGTVTISTLPRTKGMAIRLKGHSFKTDRRGKARVPVVLMADEVKRMIKSGSSDVVLVSAKVSRVRKPDGGVVEFDRFFGTTMAVSSSYRFQPSFIGPGGKPIPGKDVQSYTLKSRHGTVVTVKHDRPVMLKASRVVRYGSGLISKPIEWSLESVMVNGTNVVTRAQSRFDPSKLHRRYPINLLFFSAHFTSKDALFGSAVGKAVLLTNPEGKTTRYPLVNGQLTLPALPRGDYTVALDVKGLAPPRPVALSRNQEVELQVITRLDLALVGSLLAVIAIGLLVARRPALRRLPVQLVRRLRPRPRPVVEESA